MQTSDVPPNQTLYVSNLNEKIKPAEIKRALYHVFSQFGEIIEVNATRTYKLRGQAWVIFSDLSASTRAMREMKDFNFYGKAMKVAFAKAKSDVVSKMDGTFEARPKRKNDDEKDAVPKHLADAQKKKAEKNTSNGTSDGVHDMDAEDEDANGGAPDLGRPNSILFVQNLPENCSNEMLSMLFKQHDGFKEVRMVAGSGGIAFVEFVDEYSAGKAIEPLQGFKITPTHLMKITYAKK